MSQQPSPAAIRSITRNLFMLAVAAVTTAGAPACAPADESSHQYPVVVPDPDPGPSAVAILVGEPRRHFAALRFPIDLRSVAGSFILATPTDDNIANETAGVWFVDPAGGPGPSLRLPQPPSGWVFEGWGVTQGTPLKTGRFTSVTGPDLGRHIAPAAARSLDRATGNRRVLIAAQPRAPNGRPLHYCQPPYPG